MNNIKLLLWLIVLLNSSLFSQDLQKIRTIESPSMKSVFGKSISMDGDYAIIGAPASGGKTGAASLFKLDTANGDWNLIKTFYAPDSIINDEFGSSVSISGDLLVIGASYHNENGIGSGSAYIFSRNQGGADNWGFLKQLNPSDPISDHRFGTAVSIDNNTIAVSAPYDGGTGVFTGAVYIFSKDQGGADNWGQLKKITASNSFKNAAFGLKLDLHKNKLIVYAKHYDDGDSVQDDDGIVYIYYQDQGGTNNWGEIKQIQSSDIANNDQFGYSLSVQDTIIAVSAYKKDSYYGPVYIFYQNSGGTNSWGQVKKITNLRNRFGQSVDLDGGSLIISSNTQFQSGFGYIFTKDQGGNNNWGLKQTITGSTTSYGEFAVMKNNKVLISDPYDGKGKVDFYAVDTYPPSPPKNIVVNAGNEELKVSWDANFETDLAGYELYMGTSSDPTALLGTFSKLKRDTVIKDLNINTSYYFRVKAVDTDGKKSDYSINGLGTTTNLPLAPYNLYASHPEGAVIDLYVTSLSNSATSLTLEASVNTGPFSTFKENILPNVAGVQLTGLSDSTVYTFRVKSINPNGSSDYSNTVTILVPVALPDNFSKILDYKQSGLPANTYFGFDIDIYKDLALVTSITNNSFLYKKGPTGWTMVKEFSFLARHAAIDKDIIALSGTNSIQVYYRNEGGTDNWGLKKSIPVLSAKLTQSLDLQNNVIAVTYTNNFSGSGICIYEKNEGGADNWGRTMLEIGHYGDVSVFGNIVIKVNSQGHVSKDIVIYEKDTAGAWTSIKKLNEGITSGSQGKVSYSGDFLFASYGGSPAYIYQRSKNGKDDWVKIKTLSGYDSGIGGLSLYGDHGVFSSGSKVYLIQRNQGGANNWGIVDTLGSGITVAVGADYAVSAPENNVNAEISFYGKDIYPPKAVSMAFAESLNESARIGWTKTDASDFKTYKIYGGTSSNPTTILDSAITISDTSKVMTALSPSTKYYFRVTAVDELGNESAFSDEMSVTVSALAKAPSNFYASDSTARSVKLHWKDNSAIEAFFAIERSENSGFSVYQTLNANANTEMYVDSSLQSNKDYFYRIAAVNSNGDLSAYSDPVWIKTSYVDTVAPDSVTMLGATAGDASVSLRWSKSQAADFAKYLLYGGQSTNTTTLIDSISSSVNDTLKTINNLVNGINYYFRIKVVDTNSLVSNYSNELSAKPVDMTAPSAPFISAPFPQDITVSLKWNRSMATDFAKYRLYVSLNDANNFNLIDSISSVTDTTYSYTALTENLGKAHYFKLTAVDLNGNESIFSNTLFVRLSDNTAPNVNGEVLLSSLSGLDNHFSLYLFSNEGLVIDNRFNGAHKTLVDVSVNSTVQNRFYFSSFDENKNIYKTNITITSFGTIDLSISAYDYGKNLKSKSIQLNINKAKRGQSLNMILSKNASLNFPVNTFSEDAVVYGQKKADKKQSYLTSEGHALEKVSSIFYISSNKKITAYAEFGYNLSKVLYSNQDKRKIGLYKRVSDKWEYVSGQGRPGKLSAKFNTKGDYAVFYNAEFVALPEIFTVSQNYPNPFNPVTSIDYHLPEAARVKIEIFNLLGQRIRTLVNKQIKAGYHTVHWNSKNGFGQKVSSGIYFYRVQYLGKFYSKKMILMK